MYRDTLGDEGDQSARVYSLEACGDSLGNRYWGHVAVADYKGGLIIWIGCDWRGVKSDGSETLFAD